MSNQAASGSDARRTWVNLNHAHPRLTEGCLVRFKTNDTGAHGAWNYAVAINVEDREELSFFGLDGRGWGYGYSPAPREARFEDQPSTVDARWLRGNFMRIVEPDDPDDIWVFHDGARFLEACEELGSLKL